LKLLLSTIREFEYDQKSLINELSESELKNKVAVCLIHPETYNKIVTRSGVNLKLTSNFGSVVLRPVWDESIPLDMVYINKSIWSNQITGIIGDIIQLKNIEVNVESSEDSVPEISELLKKLKEVKG
jgi:formylmethanofuran dehydrogenase subunit D